MAQFIGVDAAGNCFIERRDAEVAQTLKRQADTEQEYADRIAQAEADLPAAEAAMNDAYAAMEAGDPTDPALIDAHQKEVNEVRALNNIINTPYDKNANVAFFRLGTNDRGKPVIGKRVRHRVRSVTVDQVDVEDDV